VNRDRSAPLDALRGLAVLAVLGVHLESNGAGGPRTQAVLALWEAHGWVGVDLFFVLSGFLIGSLLIREQEQTGTVRVGRFLIRRGFKIYPVYYTMLLWTMLPLWVMGSPIPLPVILSEALFVQNYGPSLYPVTWSLAIEEHFYLLFAGAIWLARGRRWTAHALPVVVGLALAVLAVRGATVLVLPAEQWPMHATHARLDALLWGVAIAAAVTRWPERTRSFVWSWRWALAAAAVALPAGVLALPEYHPLGYTLGLTALAWGAGALVLLAVHAPFGPWGDWWVRPLARVGGASYAIYLWQVPVRRWGGSLAAAVTGVETPTLGGLLLYVVGAVAVGWLMTVAVERPFLALRDRRYRGTPRMPTIPRTEPLLEPLHAS
jgi:peptidoglycan/LPS O-acetylase OafA/YrhL